MGAGNERRPTPAFAKAGAIGAIGALLALGLVAAASAGGGKTLLDKDSERSKDVGLGLSGSATPTNKFILKVTSKPKGVEVSAGGIISCAKSKTKSIGGQISKTKRAPFRMKIPPTVRRNRSCSMSVSLNTDARNKPFKVKAKLFHKD